MAHMSGEVCFCSMTFANFSVITTNTYIRLMSECGMRLGCAAVILLLIGSLPALAYPYQSAQNDIGFWDIMGNVFSRLDPVGAAVLIGPVASAKGPVLCKDSDEGPNYRHCPNIDTLINK